MIEHGPAVRLLVAVCGQTAYSRVQTRLATFTPNFHATSDSPQLVAVLSGSLRRFWPGQSEVIGLKNALPASSRQLVRSGGRGGQRCPARRGRLHRLTRPNRLARIRNHTRPTALDLLRTRGETHIGVPSNGTARPPA